MSRAWMTCPGLLCAAFCCFVSSLAKDERPGPHGEQGEAFAETKRALPRLGIRHELAAAMQTIQYYTALPAAQRRTKV